MKETNTPAPTPFYLSESLEGLAGTPRYGAFSNKHDNYFATNPPNQDTLDWNRGTPAAGSGLAPVDSIPNEILAHILEIAYLSEDLPNDAFRSVVSQTSSHFRRVTLGTAALWSKYHLTQGNITEYLPQLAHYLELSKQYPLDIHLNCFWGCFTTERVMDVFLPHSRRWRHLSITTPNSEIFSFLVNIPAPTLETLSLSHFSAQRRLSLDYPVFGGHLPILRSLFLRNVSLDKANIPLQNLTNLELRGYGTWPDFASLGEMLAGFNVLQNLVLHVKPSLVLQDLKRQIDDEPITLPALRSFTVFTSEWLTDDVARLIRTFEFPNIETLVVQEGPGLGCSAPDILRYTSSPLPSMTVNVADILIASRCLPPEQLQKLHTLELKRGTWTNYAFLRTMFRSMVSLEKLIILELNPHNALQELNPSSESLAPIFVPSLRMFDVDVIRRDFRPAAEDLALFIRMFAVPSLSSLVLRHLAQMDWENVVTCFAQHTSEYPRLRSLTLAAINGGTNEPTSCSPADAFPHLRTLSILSAPSNPFLSQLTQPQSATSGTVPWPDLESLMICGDPYASKPLLHRAIAIRQEVGKPLVKLFLDGAFRANLDSWEWITDRVDVVEMPSLGNERCGFRA